MISERQALHAELDAELRALRIVILSRVFARNGIGMLFSRLGALRERYDWEEIGRAVVLELRRRAANLRRAVWGATLALKPRWL